MMPETFLLPSGLKKIIDSFTASHEVVEHVHRFTRDNVCTRKSASVCGPDSIMHV